MAMSLEELLAKEGFKERITKMSARSSFQSEAASLPLYQFQDQRKLKTSSTAKKIERIKSSNAEFETNRTMGKKPKGILIRKEIRDEGPSEESIEKLERVANYLRDVQQLTVDEVTLDSNDTYKDIYSNDIYSPQTNEREMEKGKLKMGLKLDDKNSKIQVERSYKQSKTLKLRENIEDNRNSSEAAIDDASIQAVISILSGYIKRFLVEEDFRTSFHHNCVASLNFSALEEDVITESKVLENLEQAIEVVEKAAEESASAKELKKASLQLSVITGLNSNELKDGFTSGIPNSKLSACAHLYLSVVYKLQKKDKVAAKHILQVFCESPFQARAILLPELWERMFLPHFFHLRDWYNQQVELLGYKPSKTRKLKLLEKVYNEIMDSATYQFAVYYKEWLSEGVEAPSIPSINAPSSKYCGEVVYKSDSSSDSFEVGDPLSPRPMVSRELYNAVICRSRKPEFDDMAAQKEFEIFPDILTCCGSSPFEEKQALPYSFTDASNPADDLVAKDIWTIHQASIPSEGHINEKYGNISSPMINAEENEFTLKPIERPVIALEKTDRTVNISASFFPPPAANDGPYPNSYTNSIGLKSNGEESHVTYDNFDEKSSSSSIPEDFVCPLTGIVFEDPITIETGHTYEREAITKWFDEGNKTCPVSGKTLECQFVPLTNFILKRVIDSWKSEHGSKIQNKEAVLVVHQLLSAFSVEERIANGKYLISLGGLRFLVRKFQFGNLEEKLRVANIFYYCIEADGGCRNYIAKNVKKSCLVELIQSEHVKSMENVMLLLVELLCLNRRKDINLFLRGFKDEGIVETLHAISAYLRSSPPEQKPLVAILLLHFDLLVEPQEYSIYREEAVDAIITALDDSSAISNIRANCRRALLILGGRFSSSGKLITEDYILKQSGFLDNTCSNYVEDDKDGSLLDDDEERKIKEWLSRLSVSLLCDGDKSFLQSINKCLGGTNLELVRVCLTTVAWLSSALSSFSNSELPLAAFSFLISSLIETLQKCDLIEHKVLASTSMLNFSKIPECRILLTTFAKEIVGPLRDLAVVTWTAKELYAIIYRNG